MSTRGLTSKEREVIERKQFEPLPEYGDAKVYEQIQKDTAEYKARYAPGPSQAELDKLQAPYPAPGADLTLRNWVSLVTQNNTSPGNRDKHWPVDEAVVDKYYQLIYQYKADDVKTKQLLKRNKSQRQDRLKLPRNNSPNRQQGFQRRASRRGDDAANKQQGFQRRNSKRRDEAARNRPPPEPRQSIVHINSAKFKAITENDESVNKGFNDFLIQADSTPEKIREMDYLFIPYFDKDHSHHVLMGIAPKQGFVFIINSIEYDFSREEQPARGLMALAMMICPKEEKWPLYGQWASLAEHTEDNSPNCARQGDFHNCGIFNCTNLMCLAFGYRLMFYRNRDMPAKRIRMAAELMAGGFGNPPFDYTLLDIPITMGQVRDSYRYEAPSAPISVPPTPTVSGMSASKPDSNSGSSTSTTPRTNPVPAPSTRVPFNFMPKDDSPEPSGGDEGGAGSEVDGTWPEQFGSKFFRKAGFIYKVPTNIAEEHLVSKGSIVKACQEYGVKGWEPWYREPLSLFRRWFQNEVAGYLSSLKPMGFGQNLRARQVEFERRMKESEEGWDEGTQGDYWARFQEVREQFLKDWGDK